MIKKILPSSVVEFFVNPVGTSSYMEMKIELNVIFLN